MTREGQKTDDVADDDVAMFELPADKLREAVVRHVLDVASRDKTQLFGKDGQLLPEAARPQSMKAAAGRVTVTQITRDGVQVGERKRTIFGDTRQALRLINKALPSKSGAKAKPDVAEQKATAALEAREVERLEEIENEERMRSLELIWRREWEAEQLEEQQKTQENQP